jgi:hypothetical protein
MAGAVFILSEEEALENPAAPDDPGFPSLQIGFVGREESRTLQSPYLIF